MKRFKNLDDLNLYLENMYGYDEEESIYMLLEDFEKMKKALEYINRVIQRVEDIII